MLTSLVNVEGLVDIGRCVDIERLWDKHPAGATHHLISEGGPTHLGGVVIGLFCRLSVGLDFDVGLYLRDYCELCAS